MATSLLAAGLYRADVTVGDTSTLSFNSAAYIGYYSKVGSNFVPRGNVSLNGGPTLARAATIRTQTGFLINVNVSGYGNLPAAEFDGGANVTVAANSFLYLNSPYFRCTSVSPGVYFNGPGTVPISGDTIIGYSSSGILIPRSISRLEPTSIGMVAVNSMPAVQSRTGNWISTVQRSMRITAIFLILQDITGC